MSLQSHDHLLSIAQKAALEAGNMLKEAFGTSFRIDSKEGRHNLVTEYDHRAEDMIISCIHSAFPDHIFLAEESGSTGAPADTIRWIIDPLDGTVNFAHSIPIFCVSIAAEQSGKLLCGVIYAPMTSELFTGTHGGGAYLNGQALSVSTTDNLEDAILVTGFPYNAWENPQNCIDHFSRFVRMGLPVRRLGSAALDLAYLAAGRFDGYWEVSLNAWDVAAGKLLLQEAGGMITQYDGSPHNLYNGTMLATNGRIHKAMSKILTEQVS
ncbi:MAG: inositol monophosphatase family protein [Bacteroidota bacterium]|nr:inositol monophosphatase [Candidatus Kapabacteria bacterium]MDW8219062.1 inositol monophosphatase family protein [Bacteroidota bacterium]